MRKNAVTIREALDGLVNQLKLKPRLHEATIQNKWAELMGKTIARYTTAISLKNGKLFLKIESAPLKNELTYSREKICEVLNKELGEDVIKEVVIY